MKNLLMMIIAAGTMCSYAEKWYEESTQRTWRYALLSDLTAMLIADEEEVRDWQCVKPNFGYITIPATVNDYPVSRIGEGAFAQLKDLTRVDIPTGIVAIADAAFNGCSILDRAVIPSTVTAIGDTAFFRCSKLSDIVIPAKVNRIGENAFVGVLGPITVESANQCYSSQGGLLYDKSKSRLLTCPTAVSGEIVVPDGVVAIDRCAFCGCKNQTSVTLPAGIETINSDTFRECEKIEEFSIPKGVVVLGNDIFQSCTALAELHIPDSVEQIGFGILGWTKIWNDHASGVVIVDDCVLGVKGDCGSSVAFPDGTRVICAGVFADCHDITEITLPSSIRGIGVNAFGFNPISVIRVDAGDAERMKKMVADTGFNVEGVKFVSCGDEQEDEIYQVTFDATDGAAEWAKVEVAKGAAVGTLPTATREGHGFLGWFTAAAGGTQVTAATVVTEDVTFYAKWTPITYSMKFNANGGSGAMANETMSYNSAKALTACAFTRTGYTFAGWATSAGGQVVYANKQFVKNLTATQGAVINLYAKWTANAYSVKFDANGGSGTMANGSMTYDVEKALTACTFTRTGYTFAGWATSAGGAVKYADGATTKNLAASGTVTLYAKWNPIAYSVKFNANGGSGSMANESMTYDTEKALTACAFAKTGYTFAGWSVAEGGDSTVYAEGASVKNLTAEAGGVVNFYAVWKVDSYALTVKPNSTKYGSVSGSGTYDYGKTVTLKATAKDGYVFAGWYTDKACTKELGPEGYDNRKPTVKYAIPAKKTTVYAKFISKSSDKKALTFSDATQRLATSAKSFAAGKTMSLGLGFTAKSLPTVTAKDLPDGMEIDPVTGKITGKPTEPGKHTVTVTVKTAAGNSISQKVKIYVTVPSGCYGTFDGYALVKTTPAYVTLTSDKYGAVSGKVTYKGKSYSFKANYSEVSSTRAKFKPSIKIGSTTYKPVTYVEKMSDGITVSQANGEQKGKFVFVAQKKPGLIKAKKALAGMVGEDYTFKKGYKNAGLTKSGDKLKVKFGETDAVKVSGQAKGKKMSFSASVIYSGKATGEKGDVYTAMVMLVDSAAKYYKRLVFTITVDPATGKIVKVSKAFGEIE